MKGDERRLKVEVLVAAMHQSDLSLVEKMNIRTDAVIINQCDWRGYWKLFRSGRCIRMFSMSERGVGRSRTRALDMAKGEICLLADEDVVYNDDYEQTVMDAFRRNPSADIILFNMPGVGGERKTAEITKNGRIWLHGVLRFGTVNIAFRRRAVYKAGVAFSPLFGGGAPYSAGEDSLFLWRSMCRGLKVYTDTAEIGTVRMDSSTWFKGYTDKYFYDKGVFFAVLSPLLATPLILQFAIRRHGLYSKTMSFWRACSLMLAGRRRGLELAAGDGCRQ